MADDITDDWTPGVQADPLHGYEELRDVVDPLTGRMLGRFGINGMMVEEAAKKAEIWWNKHGRFQMPDCNKSNDYLNSYGMKSGILLGLPWLKLNRGERVRVVKVWHHEIGIPRHGMGFSSHKGKEFKNVLEQIEKEKRGRAFDLERVFGPPDGET